MRRATSARYLNGEAAAGLAGDRRPAGPVELDREPAVRRLAAGVTDERDEASPPCRAARSAASRGTSRYRPFCSRRCRDRDLINWLDGRYAVPSVEVDEDGAEGARRTSADQAGRNELAMASKWRCRCSFIERRLSAQRSSPSSYQPHGRAAAPAAGTEAAGHLRGAAIVLGAAQACSAARPILLQRLRARSRPAASPWHRPRGCRDRRRSRSMLSARSWCRRRPGGAATRRDRSRPADRSAAVEPPHGQPAQRREAAAGRLDGDSGRAPGLARRAGKPELGRDARARAQASARRRPAAAASEERPAAAAGRSGGRDANAFPTIAHSATLTSAAAGGRCARPCRGRDRSSARRPPARRRLRPASWCSNGRGRCHRARTRRARVAGRRAGLGLHREAEGMGHLGYPLRTRIEKAQRPDLRKRPGG